METPDEWPLEIQESYDPIRILGKGGFASVVLAREKKATENPDGSSKNNKVAIKVVGGIHDVGIDLTFAEIKQQRDQAVLYARREIEILTHVHHRNIVRLFHHWIVKSEDENENENESETKNIRKHDLTAAVLVLEYVKGPTVESLLKHGGALSTIFGRVVIAQAMDAIAYLHCHAVLHRDIKPDNILGKQFRSDQLR
jgi:serine/threonine protein kinase